MNCTKIACLPNSCRASKLNALTPNYTHRYNTDNHSILTKFTSSSVMPINGVYTHQLKAITPSYKQTTPHY